MKLHSRPAAMKLSLFEQGQRSARVDRLRELHAALFDEQPVK